MQIDYDLVILFEECLYSETDSDNETIVCIDRRNI